MLNTNLYLKILYLKFKFRQFVAKIKISPDLLENVYTSQFEGAERRICTRRNDQRFRREIATKLFRHETIFDFHMNNFDTIIENIMKLLFKMLNQILLRIKINELSSF